jgi:uroporphyrinogen-III decarboxylase
MKAEIGRGGGYILAPAHAIPGDARPENILALIEVANEE